MPNIKSSVLSVRKDAKTNAANTAKKSEMRTAIKKAKLAKTEGAANAAELVNLAYKKIDKAAKTNITAGEKFINFPTMLIGIKINIYFKNFIYITSNSYQYL